MLMSGNLKAVCVKLEKCVKEHNRTYATVPTEWIMYIANLSRWVEGTFI